jgi:hypothetical protein
MVFQIKTSGDCSWIFSPGSIPSIVQQHGQTGRFGRRVVSDSCCNWKILENSGAIGEIDTFSCPREILYGGSIEGFWWENANLWSVVRDSGRLLGTPLQFCPIARTTDHWLCPYLTAGIRACPPDIGSTSCYTIFHVLNRSSRCILDRSGGCWEDFLWVCRSSLG